MIYLILFQEEKVKIFHTPELDPILAVDRTQTWLRLQKTEMKYAMLGINGLSLYYSFKHFFATSPTFYGNLGKEESSLYSYKIWVRIVLMLNQKPPRREDL